jgi:hypothetical protein
MLVLGLVPYAIGTGMVWWLPDNLELRDFIRNLGHGFFPLAVYNFGAGYFREVNKPEKQ